MAVASAIKATKDCHAKGNVAHSLPQRVEPSRLRTRPHFLDWQWPFEEVNQQ